MYSNMSKYKQRMSFSNRFISIFKKSLPSPFSIAILLTLLSFVLAFLLTEPQNTEEIYVLQLLGFWEKGFWELLKFAMQMMLMLVLGHVLANTQLINSFTQNIAKLGTNTAKAAFWVTLFTILVSLFNWGLGLIFGAILARKTGEYASQNGIKLNYPLIGAAGYSGLMVWHGGLSGSAPLKVAESGHFLIDKIGQIPLSQTVFSTMNLTASLGLIIILPLLMYFVGNKNQGKSLKLKTGLNEIFPKPTQLSGAEKLDYSRVFALCFAIPILLTAIYKATKTGDLSVINPNYINFVLLGLGLLLHKNIATYTSSVNNAINSSTGILIQFPIYAGIMGIMKYSGLTDIFTAFFVEISTQNTYSIYTFFSAGLVNIFVPSGGGQWAIQGQIISQAAQELGVSLPKSIMALAYGDQITNMLQPFWALPLLGITGLKAKEILPYTLLLMFVGIGIFITVLLIF